MFDDVLRELQNLERGVKISVDLQLDDNGYLDRLCPSGDCQTHFKVMFEDWRDLVRDEVVYCPNCRHDADSSEWSTQEQAEHMEQIAAAYVQKEIGRAFQSDSRRFNARQRRDSLIQMSMSYRPGIVSTPVPAFASDSMTQEFTCEKCDCRYASIGAAFFCPSCGQNSVLHTFANSVQTVRKTLGSIPTIHDALVSSAGEDVAKDSIRHIFENGLVKLVSSFQRYSEACFLRLANASQFHVRPNLFQNLKESDSIWRNATSVGYTDILTNDEFKSLSTYFQQRHVLAHQDGIVDQKYIDRAVDHRFDPGQRLIVTETNVAELARIVDKLASGLDALP